VCAIAAGAWLTRWAMRARAEGSAALAWRVPGALLSLVSASGAPPSSRLLAGAQLAGAALLALALLAGFARVRGLRGGRRALGMLGLSAIVLIHGVLAAQHSATHARDYRIRAGAVERWALAAELPRDVDGVDVLVLGAADLETATYVPYIRARAGHALPRSYRQLGGAHYPHRVQRLDDHTIELTLLSSTLDGVFAGSLQRPSNRRFRAGDRVRLPRLWVEVVAVRAGNPWRLRYRFDKPLDDPSLWFLRAEPAGLRRMRMPEAGVELTLPAASAPWPASASTFL
jgi:hypothetical protein